MKKSIKLLTILYLLFCSTSLFAQKSIKEYVEKNDKEKIKKSIAIDGLCKPATGKSFNDGHGRSPYLSSKEQLPDTIALITFNISDLGFSTTWKNDWMRITEYFSVSEKGGNIISNAILKQTLTSLKEEFKKHGVVLLTIDEVLNTQEKKDYYYKTFAPEVSKIGTFLNNLENRGVDIAVCATNYRYFDLGASWDYLRSQSLGSDLARKLGVDGVLSIGNVVQTTTKDGNIRTIKMALHAPNPIPKEDKKYIGQKTGVGYYDGQIYVGGTLTFKNAINCMELGTKEITSMDFDGLEVVFESFIERFYDELDEAISKVSK